MDLAPAPRVVVFALDDLPESDRQHILSVATHLHLPIEQESWRCPLLLAGEAGLAASQMPGLMNDIEMAAGGPSLMLLALRLLLADAYHWPEQRWLTAGKSASASRVGYVLYAADPKRWTVESLAHEIAERTGTQVQRGLLPRGARPPVAPGDRVPVLGWQVPVLGGKDPISKLRDLRPLDQRQHHFGGVSAPLGMVPGSLTDRYRLFLRIQDIRREGDQASARLDLLCIDGSLGETVETTLDLNFSHLGVLADWHADEEEDLADLLRDLLPGCLLLTPRGELLVLDLYQLGLSVRPVGDFRLMGLRSCGAPRAIGDGSAGRSGGLDEGSELIDPSLWEPGLLSGLLLIEETRISASGRFVSLHFSGRRDGWPLDASLVLDTRRPGGGTTPLVWPLLTDGPSPSLAISPDERLLAVAPAPQRTARTDGAASSEPDPMPPISPACVDPSAEEWFLSHATDLLIFSLPQPGAGSFLRPCGSVSLPQPLRGPSPPSLYFLPGGRALLCHQPSGNMLCTVELPDAPEPDGGVPFRASVRPTTGRDLLALLGADGGHPLRHLLRALYQGPRSAPLGSRAGTPQDGPEEEVPSLAFLDPRNPAWPRAREFAALLRAPASEAAEAVLRDYLSTGVHTLDGGIQTTVPL